tara:strand:- start:62018 stop:65572 length:3555 start_codon:yes stop_codon:yes gene_type:complete
MTIPLDQDFTVVTGPNGSGKSNILDGILFCLGLTTSRGMRADRLPDLVNSGVLRPGKSAETIVSVRFDLTDWHPDNAEEGLEPPEEGPWIKSDQKDWKVTRRLRVMPGGSYSSTYLADGEPCNLQQLQTQLRRLRVDPDGSNVVMQGDVTRIVSMSNRDRRGIIDELAGVALFDRRIDQTRIKLDDVHDRQDRCRIVEQELLTSRQRLEKDCEKAKLYKSLKEQFQLGKKQELVLAFEDAQEALRKLKNRSESLAQKDISDSEVLLKSEKILLSSVDQLKKLQQIVKELGEDQLLSVQAEIAGLETQMRELERQAVNNKEEGEKLQQQRKELISEKEQIRDKSEQKIAGINSDLLKVAEDKFREAEAAVEVSRRRMSDIAGRSGAWVENQKERSLSRKKLQNSLQPLQKKQQNIEENLLQVKARLEELDADQTRDINENQKIHQQITQLDQDWEKILSCISSKKKDFQEKSDELEIQIRTGSRLEQEKTKLEKEIARSESRRETLLESRGTSALRILLESGLDGIHGLVAQLGEVDDRYRQALEVAAGARLGHVVVDDDRIAAKAIEVLKQRKAGRLTFLPLNKIKTLDKGFNQALQRVSKSQINDQTDGFIARAFDLISFNSIYKNVFSYVCGETLVFRDLHSARAQLGVNRLVTLDGEVLEKNGAMTGGSIANRSMGLFFGSSKEGDEIQPMRERLLELGETLVNSKNKEVTLNNNLENLRSELVNLDQRKVALETERESSKRLNSPLIDRQKIRSERLKDFRKNQEIHTNDLKLLAQEINPLILELAKLDENEQILHKDVNADNWDALQIDLENAESSLELARTQRDDFINDQRQSEFSLQRLQDQSKTLLIEENRLKTAVESLAKLHQEWRKQNQVLNERRNKLEIEQRDLETRFGEQRRARDLLESDVANQRQKLQESQWNLDRLRDERKSIEEELRTGNIRIKELEKKLPDPLPEISNDLRSNGLEALQSFLETLQKRMEALEPVNMLALEELGKLEKRLEDLIQRLEVLSQERGELLLRIENVATLRQEAFMEAFEAVDVYFREIFASLSEGDGHLQLDNPEDPLEGGLTLVAHPKGKSVRRLAAMSGGEKSLTALSFLFALQRFRPSPFYALDEVDSFLDGVNVERLSALIAKQSNEAQFLVVSHRRPMIGAATRTIGVTQARGAHTQVIGLPIAA